MYIYIYKGIFITFVWSTDAATFLLVSGQMCISGFEHNPEDNSHDTSQVVPFLGRFREFNSPEQWIFPNLQFTCHGKVTKWIFRGDGNRHADCLVQLTTWRLRGNTGSSVTYERISTTHGNTAYIRANGSIFTYELGRAVSVHAGDIVGAEINCQSFFGPFEKLNILGLDVSGSGSQDSVSYGQYGSGSWFFLRQFSSVIVERELQPIVQAILQGKLAQSAYLSLET